MLLPPNGDLNNISRSITECNYFFETSGSTHQISRRTFVREYSRLLGYDGVKTTMVLHVSNLNVRRSPKPFVVFKLFAPDDTCS